MKLLEKPSVPVCVLAETACSCRDGLRVEENLTVNMTARSSCRPAEPCEREGPAAGIQPSADVGDSLTVGLAQARNIGIEKTMAMDAKAKQALAKKVLADETAFHTLLSNQNRAWFVAKIIDARDAAGDSATQIEATTRDVMTKTKAIAAAKADFHVKLGFETSYPSFEAGNRQRRVELLYGIVSEDIRFADPANAGYLDFIAARRYRSVGRMQTYIESDSFVVYPSQCEGADRTKKVNIAARPYWMRLNPNDPVPLKLKPQAGGVVAPLTAFEKVWTQQDDPCDRNIFDCAYAAALVLLDGLLEAKDPGKLLEAIRTRAADFLRINHPNFNAGEHPLYDTGPTRLFTKEYYPPEDLQVGDHVYIQNHALYRFLDPFGEWRGEHALVSDLGNRSLSDTKGIRFTGHGVGVSTGKEVATAHELYDHLAKLMNTLLSRAFAIGLLYLNHRSGQKVIPANQVSQTTTAAFGHPNDPDYSFDVDFEYFDFTDAPDGAAPIRRKDHGIRVIHIPAEKSFLIVYTLDTGNAALWTVFHRVGDPPAGVSEFADPTLWQLRYEDYNGQLKHFEIFKRERGKIRLQLMKRSEMPTSPFGKFDPTKTGAIVTRPTVDFSASYQSYLTTNGAI